MDRRLQIVAERIRGNTHADIGSDHAGLLVHLLQHGRIHYGIAIENKRQPFENSRRALAGLAADVRLADGLSGLRAGEVDSLSICGMGADNIVKILDAEPSRVPSQIVLQPNARAELVREWGRRSGYHLVFEEIIYHRWDHHILAFQVGRGEVDPAYEGIDLEAALILGPHHIQAWRPEFVAYLHQQRAYLQRLPRLAPRGRRRLVAIERLLAAAGQA